MKSENTTKSAIAAMLQPRSIAVVGATERLQYGGRFLNNLIAGGFKGRLYPVNPRRDHVFGLPCFSSITALPEAVDLAAIIIPSSGVMAALRECADRGVRSAVVIAAGFAELPGEEGQQLQAQMRQLARESGVRVCGPNCLGIANVAQSIWPCSAPSVDPEVVVGPGSIGLVSQSGASAFGPLMAVARDRQIGFRYVVSTGNEADLEASDFIDFMLDDPEVKVVALLAEGFRNGPKLIKVADRALELGKPIVVLKQGRSAVGAKAALTHTAALAGSDEVHSAAFKQQGMIRVDDYDELVETAAMFAKTRLPRGEGIGLVSHSGGISGAIGDKSGELGLSIPELTETTQRKIETILEGRGAATNPADITYHAHRETFPTILEAMLNDKVIDLLGIATAGKEEMAQAVIDTAKKTSKPVLFLWTGRIRDNSGLPMLQTSEIPVFYLPGGLAKGIRSLIDYSRVQRQRHERHFHGESVSAREARDSKSKGITKSIELLRSLLDSTSHQPLDEHQGKQVLSLFGIPTSRESLCQTLDEGIRAASRVGYPIAVKAISPDIPHKTEAGVVRLGVRTDDELMAAWQEVLANARARAPRARIEGILIQEMVRGCVEVIAGITRDPQFGPVMVFGLGGVLVEAVSAVSRRLCPISPGDAWEMVAEVKGMDEILRGYRGRPAADRESLVDCLVRLSSFAASAGDLIAGLDINPLIVLPKGEGVKAVDALVIPGAVVPGTETARTVGLGLRMEVPSGINH